MEGQYVAFVAAAYGVSAFALGALSAWIVRDARRMRARLAELERSGGRPRAGAPSPGTPSR